MNYVYTIYSIQSSHFEGCSHKSCMIRQRGRRGFNAKYTLKYFFKVKTGFNIKREVVLPEISMANALTLSLN